MAIQAYEAIHYPFPVPKSVPEMVEQKHFELNLTVSGLAELLGLGKTTLTQILNGKRDPDVSFLKAVYHKLGIAPGVLLDNACPQCTFKAAKSPQSGPLFIETDTSIIAMAP